MPHACGAPLPLRSGIARGGGGAWCPHVFKHRCTRTAALAWPGLHMHVRGSAHPTLGRATKCPACTVVDIGAPTHASRAQSLSCSTPFTVPRVARPLPASSPRAGGERECDDHQSSLQTAGRGHPGRQGLVARSPTASSVSPQAERESCVGRGRGSPSQWGALSIQPPGRRRAPPSATCDSRQSDALPFPPVVLPPPCPVPLFRPAARALPPRAPSCR